MIDSYSWLFFEWKWWTLSRLYYLMNRFRYFLPAFRLALDGVVVCRGGLRSSGIGNIAGHDNGWGAQQRNVVHGRGDGGSRGASRCHWARRSVGLVHTLDVHGQGLVCHSVEPGSRLRQVWRNNKIGKYFLITFLKTKKLFLFQLFNILNPVKMRLILFKLRFFTIIGANPMLFDGWLIDWLFISCLYPVFILSEKPFSMRCSLLF